MPSVRRFGAHEWRTYRDLRLRALADSPDAFGGTLESERLRSDAEWSARLESGVGDQWNLPLLAEATAAPIGLAWGRIEKENPEIAHVYQMWVAPAHRARGVGALLLSAITAWARSMGGRRVVLSVTCGDSVARRLYERAGFEPVGESQLLRPGSELKAQPMELDLGQPRTDTGSEV
jgi:GNAT superfamily N-acetyltransferase